VCPVCAYALLAFVSVDSTATAQRDGDLVQRRNSIAGAGFLENRAVGNRRGDSPATGCGQAESRRRDNGGGFGSSPEANVAVVVLTNSEPE